MNIGVSSEVQQAAVPDAPIQSKAVAIVREIIENVAEGSSLYAEAKRLNDLGLATPGWRYGNGKKRPGAKLWSVMTGRTCAVS